jgi:5-methyltetrahydropteroyltriglutamate--homocysteine methyltransferase
MALLTASAGSYPRIGDEPDRQRLRVACTLFARGEIGAGELAAVEDAVATEILQEQAEAGLDVVTDGLVRWYDPISHVTQALLGLRFDGLRRYFDTACEFRRPVVRGPIMRTRAIVADEFRFAAARSPRAVKAVLTGPLTLATASVIETPAYPGIETLTLTYAEVLAAEVSDLVAAGARHVQIDEPAILGRRGDLALLGRALAPIAAAKGSSELVLATYFGDATPILAELACLPVDVLALDLISAPALADELARVGLGRRVALGIVDGRNSRLESLSERARVVEGILPALPDGPHYLTSSCGLEYLPRERARRKLERLVEIRAALAGAGT